MHRPPHRLPHPRLTRPLRPHLHLHLHQAPPASRRNADDHPTPSLISNPGSKWNRPRNGNATYPGSKWNRPRNGNATSIFNVFRLKEFEPRNSNPGSKWERRGPVRCRARSATIGPFRLDRDTPSTRGQMVIARLAHTREARAPPRGAANFNQISEILQDSVPHAPSWDDGTEKER